MTKRILTWHSFSALVGRDAKNLFGNPAWVIFHVGLPLVLAAILGYLTKGHYGGAGIRSYDFYGVTLLLFSALSTAMTASNNFMERSIMPSNLRVLYAPVAPAAVYSSKIIATGLFASICFAFVVAGLRVGFRVNFGGSLFPYVAAIVAGVGVFSAAVGVMFCCLLRSEEVANKVVSPISQIIALAGGLFFPLDGISETMARLSWYSPAKWIVEATFRIIYDRDVGLFWPTMAVLAAGTGIAWLVCRWTFRTEDYV